MFFDGQTTTPYIEASNAAPLSTYDPSKLEADEGIFDTGAAAMVLRTRWLYSGHGPSFVQTILDKLMNGDSLRIVDDQLGTPTFAEFLSYVAHCLIPHLPPIDGPSVHLINGSCRGRASRFGLVSQCKFFASEKRPSLNFVALRPISASKYGAAAQRPPNSCLSTCLLEENYSITPLGWREEPDRVFLDIDL